MNPLKISRFEAALAVVLSVLLLSAGALLAQPKITFEETMYDWGRALEGENINHVFKFQNTGKKVLKISKVNTSCGCTAALASSDEIKPNDSGEINVSFNSTGRMGVQSKTIYVASNDPANSNVTLTIKGEVYVLLRVEPRSVNFGDIPRGKSKTMSVKIIPWGGTKFQITSLEAPGDVFTARVLGSLDVGTIWKAAMKSTKEGLSKKFAGKPPEPGSETEATEQTMEEMGGNVDEAKTIAVTISPSAAIGGHSGRMFVHTDMKEKELIEIPVYANIVGNIEVEPRAHNFGVLQKGETKDVSFTVYSRMNKIFKIDKVENSADNAATVEITEVEPGTKYQARVTLLPTAPTGRLYGIATLYTNDPGQPQVEIRYYADIRE
jgi:hypothetical protein